MIADFSTNICRFDAKFFCLGKVPKTNRILILRLYLKMFPLHRDRHLHCFYFYYSICLTAQLHEEKGQRPGRIFPVY